MKKYEINIQGIDGYRYCEDHLAENFTHAYLIARKLLVNLNKIVMAELSITSIAELDSPL